MGARCLRGPSFLALVIGFVLPTVASATFSEGYCLSGDTVCWCVTWNYSSGEYLSMTCPVPQDPSSPPSPPPPPWDDGAGGTTSTPPGDPLSPTLQNCLSAGKSSALKVGNLSAPKLKKDPEYEPTECMNLFADYADEGYGNGKKIVNQYTTYRSGQHLNGDDNPCVTKNAAAFTFNPGSGYPFVFLCNSFCGLSFKEKGVKVIHEALHTAGLRENPPAPADIDRLVREKCPK